MRATSVSIFCRPPRPCTPCLRAQATAEERIGRSLERAGLPPSATTIARIRRAMAIPLDDRFQPLPGAAELLLSIRDMGMRSVIASNTYWRDAESYWDDFRVLG